jgi:hypothetical protein
MAQISAFCNANSGGPLSRIGIVTLGVYSFHKIFISRNFARASSALKLAMPKLYKPRLASVWPVCARGLGDQLPSGDIERSEAKPNKLF